MENPTDVYLAIFSRNEQYHDHKEQMVWVGTSVYLSFSAVAIGWLVGSPNGLQNQCGVLLPVLGTLYLLAATFVWTQNIYKSQSAVISEQLRALLGRMDDGDLKCAQIQRAAEYPRSRPLCSRLRDYAERGRTGLLCLLATTVGFAFQVYLVLNG